jgi:hypothetical protein
LGTCGAGLQIALVVTARNSLGKTAMTVSFYIPRLSAALVKNRLRHLPKLVFYSLGALLIEAAPARGANDLMVAPARLLLE